MNDKQYKLHLDHQIKTGFLYRTCDEPQFISELNAWTKPDVDINTIDFEYIRVLDIKLFPECFNNKEYLNIFKNFLTVNFKKENIDTNDRCMNYKKLHVNNNPRFFYNIFKSKEYFQFKKIINEEKNLLVDNIILEVHDVYHSNKIKIPYIHSDKFNKVVENDLQTYPRFSAFEFVIRDDSNASLKEIHKKIIINNSELKVLNNVIVETTEK